MKSRIQIDTLLLVVSIIITGIFFFTKTLYPTSRIWDNFFNVAGIILILKGNLIRMMARGHKKKMSQQGQALVMSGLYSVIRNPMYFGSFLVGCGFVLLLCPFWILPLFILVFHIRFNRQMVKEERLLKRVFGRIYEEYCQNAPRFFPAVQNIFRLESKRFLDFREIFSTKEKWSFLSWLICAYLLEIIQERVVFGFIHPLNVASIFLAAIILYAILLGFKYRLG